ncbi:uncharacterized protein LOC114769648 [Denticeps clupeoides]|uniref:uncharacterized protein LOC114769648 n=1 Tax=Denticeps clupeoides TaxID=299321 RepID=UPI0010A4A80F|nr:uncharacterized protein LOC114769648 [Denticeps clupeoides]
MLCVSVRVENVDSRGSYNEVPGGAGAELGEAGEGMSVPRRTMAATLLLASLCVWPPHVGGVAGEAAELRLTGLRSTQNEKFSAEPGDSADRGQRAGVELSAREIGERSGLLSGSRDVFPGHAFPTLIQTSNSTTDPQESGGAAQPNPRAREKLLGSNMSTSQRGLTNDPLESATLQIPPDSMDGDGPAAGGRGLRLWPELGLGVKEADRRALPTDSSRGWGLGLGGGASQGILGATQPLLRD